MKQITLSECFHCKNLSEALDTAYDNLKISMKEKNFYNIFEKIISQDYV